MTKKKLLNQMRVKKVTMRLTAIAAALMMREEQMLQLHDVPSDGVSFDRNYGHCM
jgi:hypothetical protein